MNQTKSKEELKKQETLLIVILIVLFLLILIVSRFALGINVGLLEGRQYQSIGYNEIRNGDVWTVAFNIFSGTISTVGELADVSDRSIYVQSSTNVSSLELTVVSDGISETIPLSNGRTEVVIPGDGSDFRLSLCGDNVQNGYFNAVWN